MAHRSGHYGLFVENGHYCLTQYGHTYIWVSLRRTGKMYIACGKGIVKNAMVKKLWPKQNILGKYSLKW